MSDVYRPLDLVADELMMYLAGWLDDVALLMLSRTSRRFFALIQPEAGARRLGSGRPLGREREIGRVPFCEWNMAMGVSEFPWWVRDATWEGYADIMLYAEEKCPEDCWPLGRFVEDEHCASWLLYYAALAGSIPSIKHLRGVPWNGFVHYYAALSGSIEALRWVNGMERATLVRSPVEAAALSGNLDVFRYALESLGPQHPELLTYYAGSSEVLDYACELGGQLKKSVTYLAALRGKPDVLKRARMLGCRWDREICPVAAANGHLDVLAWALENGAPLHTDTCRSAASGGSVEALQWAVEHGCPYNLLACLKAAQRTDDLKDATLAGDAEMVQAGRKKCVAYLRGLFLKSLAAKTNSGSTVDP